MPDYAAMQLETREALLRKICVEWGFCLGPDDAQRIVDMPKIDAEAFATAVLAAERMTEHGDWKRQLMQAFEAA